MNREPQIPHLCWSGEKEMFPPFSNTHPLPGLYAQRLLIDHVAPSDYFIEHSGYRHFFLRRAEFLSCYYEGVELIGCECE